MRTIKINTPILTFKGEQIKGEDGKTPQTARDFLLVFLANANNFTDKKEIFWIYELGTLIANDKNKEIEISDDKAKLIIKLVEKNKIKNRMGEETQLYSPLVIAQLLKIVLPESELKDLEEPKAEEKIKEKLEK